MSWMTLLWAGLLAVGLPLLIHRMRRRGTVRLPISSVSLIRSGRDRARRRWSRERSLLLWIRLAALGSLAMALSMAISGENPESMDMPDADRILESGSDTELDRPPRTGTLDQLVVALAVEPGVAAPLTTAIRLLGESRPVELESSPPDHPQIWSRERRLVGAEDAREVWLQQGWSGEQVGSGEWLSWIRSGGHLVIALSGETSVVPLNRWLSSAGLEIRVEPAREEVLLSTEGLNDWLGEDLYGRTVDAPRMDLPESSPGRILHGAVDTDVLLRSERGDPLIWRESLGAGWITLSVLEWDESGAGWTRHPLFPVLLQGLLTLPETARDNRTMEEGVDTLTTRSEQRVEPVRPEPERPQDRMPWRMWAWIGMALLLTESVAGRYLSGKRERRPAPTMDRKEAS